MSDKRPASPVNVITGLLRAGSTLTQNVFNQNPDIFASSTSSALEEVAAKVASWSRQPEIKALLGEHRESTEEWLRERAHSSVVTYHSLEKRLAQKEGAKFLFDKCRQWSLNLDLLWSIYPNARVIVCVRDLRDVVASIERHYRKNGLLDASAKMTEKGLRVRIEADFDLEKGRIGFPLGGIMDMIDRLRFDDDRVIVLRAEDLVKNSEKEMQRVYRKLGLEYFDHQFATVENTAIDPDHIYLFEFPHEGSGAVEKTGYSWGDYFSDDVAKMIVEKCPGYFQQFKYDINDRSRALGAKEREKRRNNRKHKRKKLSGQSPLKVGGKS